MIDENASPSSPTVSVLIPAWNGERYIKEAIESVLKQTFLDFELIVADDCSTDNTAAIVKVYETKDNRLRLIRQPVNLGCNKNINYLLLTSRGKYLKILIQDDVLHKDYLKECVKILNKHPRAGLVTSFQKFIGDWHTYRKAPTVPFTGELDGRQMQKSLIGHRNWIGGETATMFRREALVTGLWNTEWGWVVDGDAWMRMLADWNLYVIPKVLSFPRIHKGQATVYLSGNFSFLREELEHLQIIRLFPNLYGPYTTGEFQEIIKKKFLRVLEEFHTGLTRGSFLSFFHLGLAYLGISFFPLLIYFYIGQCIKIFRQVVCRFHL